MAIQVIHGNSSPVLAGAAGAAAGIETYLNTKAVVDRMQQEAEQFKQLKQLRQQQIEAGSLSNTSAAREMAYREEDRGYERESQNEMLRGRRLGNDAAELEINEQRRAIEQDVASAEMAAHMAQQLGASREEIAALVEMGPEDRTAWLEQAHVKRHADSQRQAARRLLAVAMSPFQPQDGDPSSPEGIRFGQMLETLQGVATASPEAGAKIAQDLFAQMWAAQRDQDMRAAKAESVLSMLQMFQGDNEATDIINSALQSTVHANAGFPETFENDMMVLNDAVARAEWLHMNPDTRLESIYFDPMMGFERPEDSPYYKMAKDIRRAVKAGAITAQDAVQLTTDLQKQIAEDRRRVIDGSMRASGRGQDPYQKVGDHPRYSMAPVDAEGNAAAYDPSAVDPGMVRAFDYWRGLAVSDLVEESSTKDRRGKRLALDDPKVIARALELMQTEGGWVINSGSQSGAQERLDYLTLMPEKSWGKMPSVFDEEPQ